MQLGDTRNKLDLEGVLPQLDLALPGEDGCCAGGSSCAPETCQEPAGIPATLPPFATGNVSSGRGPVIQISTALSHGDRLGIIKCRLGIGRDDYRVEPGLYAAGTPSPESEVLVTANYKYSLDVLRRELAGIDAWILVLDTRGINVWCAAGKGTFGTAELVTRVCVEKLDRVVCHRRLVLPQLGAVGVSAHEVRKASGFKVRFGPVHARDLPAYLSAGRRAAPEMRRMRFPLKDRLALTPMELIPAARRFPLFALIILLAFGLEPSGILFKEALAGGYPLMILGLTAIVAGAFVTPALLPWLPFHSFALKGWLTGLAASVATLALLPVHPLLAAGSLVFFPMASSYLALQFTGSTTFTGMSGVKKELKAAIPIYLVALAIAALLLLAFKIAVEWSLI